jgi:methionyl aminopeptidase
MIELNDKILKEATKIVRSGVRVQEIGEKVQEVMEDWNEKEGSRFSVIKSLSGHSLGEHQIHAGISISNYRNNNKTELEDLAFAIEPFVTTGDGDIYEGKEGGIYVLQADEQVRDRDAREVLNFIKENYQTRPFCLRWLEKEGFTKLKFVMSVLCKQGILHQYPILIEKSKMPVSQSENTFLIHDGKVVVTTA